MSGSTSTTAAPVNRGLGLGIDAYHDTAAAGQRAGRGGEQRQEDEEQENLGQHHHPSQGHFQQQQQYQYSGINQHDHFRREPQGKHDDDHDGDDIANKNSHGTDKHDDGHDDDDDDDDGDDRDHDDHLAHDQEDNLYYDEPHSRHDGFAHQAAHAGQPLHQHQHRQVYDAQEQQGMMVDERHGHYHPATGRDDNEEDTSMRHHHDQHHPGGHDDDDDHEYHGQGGMSDDDEEEEEEEEEEDDLSSSPSIPDEHIDFDLVYALHTFLATVEGQASVVKGDQLTLLDDSNSYWWLVRVLKTSAVGYIPAENIETPFERLARLNKHRNVDVSAKCGSC